MNMEQQSKTKRAGLVLSVARVERNLKKGRYAKRISPTSSVYLAAVLEYLTAEVAELSAEACIQNKKKRIIPRHIMLAIEHDPELKELLGGVTIPHAGVLPHIEPILLPPNSKKRRSDDSTASVDDSTASKVAQSQEI